MVTIIVLLCGLAVLPAAADFKLPIATPTVEDLRLQVNARLALELNPATEEALHKGIPLEVVFDINLLRHRWWWTNKLLADWTLRRQISFHALSRQYLVSGMTPSRPAESFGALDLALVHAGNLSRLELGLTPKKNFDPSARHLMQLRARLDIESLPSVMRPLAYASPAWRLNTGWTEWTVQR